MPSSVLFDLNNVAVVRMEYANPKVLWFGKEESYVETFHREDAVSTFMLRLSKAARNGWRPVLDLYQSI